MVRNKEKQQKAQKSHYQQNKAKYFDRTKQRRIERSKWWADYKIEKKFKCSKCSESHPACISFHHRDPKEKHMGVADLVGFAYSVDVILAEIEKCDILCHNCHAKYHWESDFRRRNVLFGEIQMIGESTMSA